MWPLRCSASTTRIFWSAVTRANRISGASSASCSCAGVMRRSSSPCTTRGSLAVHEPDLARDRQRRVRMVAGDHDDLDAGRAAARDRAGTSGRGGSSSPTRPGEHQRLPRSGAVVRRQLAVGEASTRSPALGHRRPAPARMRGRVASHRAGPRPAARLDAVQSGSTASSAPLQYSSRLSACRTSIDIRWRSRRTGSRRPRSSGAPDAAVARQNFDQRDLHRIAEPAPSRRRAPRFRSWQWRAISKQARRRAAHASGRSRVACDRRATYELRAPSCGSA